MANGSTLWNHFLSLAGYRQNKLTAVNRFQKLINRQALGLNLAIAPNKFPLNIMQIEQGGGDEYEHGELGS